MSVLTNILSSKTILALMVSAMASYTARYGIGIEELNHGATLVAEVVQYGALVAAAVSRVVADTNLRTSKPLRPSNPVPDERSAS